MFPMRCSSVRHLQERLFLQATANPIAKITPHPRCFPAFIMGNPLPSLQRHQNSTSRAASEARMSLPVMLTWCDAFWISLMTDLESVLRGQETTMKPAKRRSHSRASRFISRTCHSKMGGKPFDSVIDFVIDLVKTGAPPDASLFCLLVGASLR